MTEKKIQINIASEFSTTPGPRNQAEGDFSGETFLSQKLEPAFLAARENSKKVFINLDGAEGYATSFLEAAFGGLSRKYGFQEVLGILEFQSDEEPYLVDEIQEYIREANAR